MLLGRDHDRFADVLSIVIYPHGGRRAPAAVGDVLRRPCRSAMSIGGGCFSSRQRGGGGEVLAWTASRAARATRTTGEIWSSTNSRTRSIFSTGRPMAPRRSIAAGRHAVGRRRSTPAFRAPRRARAARGEKSLAARLRDHERGRALRVRDRGVLRAAGQARRGSAGGLRAAAQLLRAGSRALPRAGRLRSRRHPRAAQKLDLAHLTGTVSKLSTGAEHIVRNPDILRRSVPPRVDNFDTVPIKGGRDCSICARRGS